MPRDADLQAAWDAAVAVNRKKLRAGDLLFLAAQPTTSRTQECLSVGAVSAMTLRMVIREFKSTGCVTNRGTGSSWLAGESNEPAQLA
jgi:hypothetical protein